MRLLLMFALLLAPAPLYACTCITVPPKTAFKQAEAVFLGEVLSYEDTVARMRVVEWFKGPKENVEVTTGRDSASCGYGGLAVGSRHLVYAQRFEGQLLVSLCSRSRAETHAACDLRYLRSRSAWWRSPLSSIRILSRIERRDPCG
jgi:hypothetical protein